MKRVHFLVDSNNAIASLAYHGIDGRHFNLRGYLESLLDHTQVCESITVYGAVFPQEINKERYISDSGYYNFLRSKKQNIKVKFGWFHTEHKLVEKGVDVMLATDLIFGAMYDDWDDVYIFSGDRDFLPAVEAVRKKWTSKRIFVINRESYRSLQYTYHGAIVIHPVSTKKFEIDRPIDKQAMNHLLEKFKPKHGK